MNEKTIEIKLKDYFDLMDIRKSKKSYFETFYKAEKQRLQRRIKNQRKELRRLNKKDQNTSRLITIIKNRIAI